MQIKKKQLAGILRIPIIILLGTLFTASFYGLYYINQKPATIEKQIPTYNYEHKGDITYQAHIKPNMVFKETTLGPGKTIYSKLLESFNIYYSYQFEADKPAKLKGTYNITATLEAKDMWKLDFVLEPQTKFNETGKNFSFNKERPINLDYFKEIVKQVDDELGVSAREPKLIIKANINLEADNAEGTVKDSLAPTMIIPLTSGAFQVDGELSVNKNGSLSKTLPVPNPIKEKWVYALTLAVFLGMLLVLFLLLTQNKPVNADKRKNEIEFWKKYGDRMVKVTDELFPAEIISLNSMEDLVKVADELGKPIIYRDAINSKDTSSCYVFDGPTAYKYIMCDNEKINYDPNCVSKKMEIPNV